MQRKSVLDSLKFSKRFFYKKKRSALIDPIETIDNFDNYFFVISFSTSSLNVFFLTMLQQLPFFLITTSCNILHTDRINTMALVCRRHSLTFEYMTEMATTLGAQDFNASLIE